MGVCLRGTGIIIVRMGRVSLLVLMGLSLLENLTWTFNKDSVRKLGLESPFTRAILRKARSMEKVALKFWENLVMRVILTRTLSMGSECTF